MSYQNVHVIEINLKNIYLVWFLILTTCAFGEWSNSCFSNWSFVVKEVAHCEQVNEPFPVITPGGGEELVEVGGITAEFPSSNNVWQDSRCSFKFCIVENPFWHCVHFKKFSVPLISPASFVTPFVSVGTKTKNIFVNKIKLIYDVSY